MGAYEEERDAILEKFGLALSVRRKEKGVSQEAFGRIASVHRNEIGALERGEREPGLLMLLILAEATGASVAELTEDLPTPTDRKPRRRAARAASGEDIR